MALHVSDRTLENVANGTVLFGVFVAAFAFLQLGAALVSHSDVRDITGEQRSGQGSWVISTVVVAIVIGVAWVVNRIAVRRKNASAKRASIWGICLNAGGHLTFVAFYYMSRAWHA